MSFGGPHYGFLAARSELHPPDAGPHRRRDGRRRGRARLCPHPADPRAAHPPREGDVEHHDEPDAARARRPRLPLVARPAGAARAGGDLHGASPSTRRSALRSRARARVSRSDNVQGVCRPRRTARARGRPATPAQRGVHPGYALGRDYAGLDDALLVARHREAHAGGHRPARRGAREVPREADLREVAGRAAAACDAAAPRPARAGGARGAPPRGSRRACPRSPSPSSSATSPSSRPATSGSTPASTRSAPAR